jgi:YegS/Rv2252/BmrU family lipid kinase
LKVRAILNPRAGVTAERALAAVEGGRRFWPELDVMVTTRAGDARIWAAEAAAAGFDAVLAVGGDGTANEVAWGLLGSETALGLVPVGSGNGLARALGISLKPREAVPQIAAGVRRRMDVGMANDRPFLNIAGAGFDAAVGAAFHRRGEEGGRRGLLAYVRIALGMAFGYRSETFRIEAGAQRFEGPALIVAFLNGRQYGGGAVMAPGARLDDGLLDVVVIEDCPRLEVLLNVPRVFLGRIEGFKRYRRFAAADAVLTGAAPVEHYRDGEPEEGVAALRIRLLPKALSILVPRARAEDPNGLFTPEGA